MLAFHQSRLRAVSLENKGYCLLLCVFPYDHPAIFTMPLTFIAIFIISKFDGSKRAKIDRSGFEAQDFRAQSGVGASEAVAH